MTDWRDEEAAANAAAVGAPQESWGSWLSGLLPKRERFNPKQMAFNMALPAVGYAQTFTEPALGPQAIKRTAVDPIVESGKGVLQQTEAGLKGQPINPGKLTWDIFNTVPLGAGVAQGVVKAVPEGGAVAGMFIGQKGAKSLSLGGNPKPMNAIRTAEEMQAAGKSPQEIWEATGKMLEGTPYAGAFQGVDGKMRVELDDSTAKVTRPPYPLSFANSKSSVNPGGYKHVTGAGEPSKNTRGTWLDHPELYKAYPELKRGRMKWEKGGLSEEKRMQPGEASFNPDDDITTFGRPRDGELKPVMMHENTHGVQSVEDFNFGMSRSTSIPRLRYELLTRHSENPELALKLSEDLVKAAKEDPSVAYEAYRRTAGEAEARNVENRTHMDIEQRRAMPPFKTYDVPEDKQWAVGKFDILGGLKSEQPPLSISLPDGNELGFVKPARAKGDELVNVDVDKFDKNFASQPDWYVGPQGAGGIPGRYGRAQEFIKGNKQMDASEAHIAEDGTVGFTDGRHRYAALRDQGVKKMPMSLTPESVANAKKFGYLAANDKNAAPLSIGANFLTERNAAAQFPQYADVYPEVGPPQLMAKQGAWQNKMGDMKAKRPEQYPASPMPGVDPYDLVASDKDSFFLAKRQMPEAEEFMKARTKVQADMNKNGFAPFFAPDERFDVPKGNYDRPWVTDDIKMKSDKGHEDWLARVDTPENVQRLKDMYFAGAKKPDTYDWYFLGQLEAFARKKLGEEKGIAAFKDFTSRMAATTGGMRPQDNLLLAHWARYAHDHGVDVRNIPAHQIPSPVGTGKYGSANSQKSVADYFEGKEFGLENPKKLDFQDAFRGHDTGVVDEQMMKGWGSHYINPKTGKPDKAVPSKPTDGTYGYHTNTMAKAAKEIGVTRKKFQEVAWPGHPKEGGQPFIQTINEAIERTHRLTGRPREEIALDVLLAQKPLYSNAPSAAALAPAFSIAGPARRDED